MTLALYPIPRFLLDEKGNVIRDDSGRPLKDDFLGNFEDEVVRLLLFMLSSHRWSGHRFENELLGIPLFLRKIRNRGANGWGGLGPGLGTEIGRRDKSWKILICSFDPSQVSPQRAQKILDIGWANLTPRDDFALAPEKTQTGHHRGLASIIGATMFSGDRDVFTQDMMMMRLYSSDR